MLAASHVENKEKKPSFIILSLYSYIIQKVRVALKSKYLMCASVQDSSALGYLNTQELTLVRSSFVGKAFCNVTFVLNTWSIISVRRYVTLLLEEQFSNQL